jgi:DNA repair exonuclease SbcCD ATPase subunit
MPFVKKKKVTGQDEKAQKGKRDISPARSEHSEDNERRPLSEKPPSSKAASEGSSHAAPKEASSSLLKKYPTSEIDKLYKPIDLTDGMFRGDVEKDIRHLNRRLVDVRDCREKLKTHKEALKKEIKSRTKRKQSAEKYKLGLAKTEKEIDSLKGLIKNLTESIGREAAKIEEADKTIKEIKEKERDWLADHFITGGS